MAARKSSPRSLAALEWILVTVLGAVLGSALAALARALLGDGPVMGLLTRTWTIGFQPPVTLDLRVLTFTFGATLEVGLLTAVGAAFAAWLYLRIR
jgi:hypothetical protein